MQQLRGEAGKWREQYRADQIAHTEQVDALKITQHDLNREIETLKEDLAAGARKADIMEQDRDEAMSRLQDAVKAAKEDDEERQKQMALLLEEIKALAASLKATQEEREALKRVADKGAENLHFARSSLDDAKSSTSKVHTHTLSLSHTHTHTPHTHTHTHTHHSSTIFIYRQ